MWIGVALAAGVAYGQTDKADWYEQHEHKNIDPYKPLLNPKFSRPRARNTTGYNIVQVNTVGGLNTLGDAANEPSLTVNPLNPNQIAVGWRQFDNATSNFRQGGYGWTADGGQTWQKGTLTPGVFRSDPVLDTTANGTLHYNSLQTTFYDDEFTSTNGGASWTMVGPATGGDKQWIAIDRTTGPGAGNVYQFWSTAGNNYGGRQFSRTTNGGTSWMDPINVPGTPIWGTPVVGPNGDLYMAGSASNAAAIRFLKSTNAQNAAVTPSFLSYVTIPMGGDITSGLSINPGGLAGQVWCICDTGNGPTRGNIYVGASIVNGSNGLHLMVNRSTNGGTSFMTTPVRVNDDGLTAGNFHWFGCISVAPNGRLDATWMDTRQDPTGHKMSALYWSQSIDGGLTWSPNVAISGTFDPLIGWPNQNKIGDYTGMVSSNRDVAVIFPGTFNGEQDVYFVRIPALPIRLTGTVVLDSYTGANAMLVGYELRNSGGTVLQSGATTLGATGQFGISVNPDIVHQSLRLVIRGSHWLGKTARNANIGLANVDFGSVTLSNGDVNGDNRVNLTDFSQLSAAYGSTTNGPNWNAGADLNGDGRVNLSDFSILSTAYGRIGE